MCLALGELHPDYLLEKLTSRQIVEWQAWFLEHPFGDDLRDYMTAQLTSIVCNLVASKESHRTRPTDFMPYYRKAEMNPDQMKHVLRGVLSGLNHR